MSLDQELNLKLGPTRIIPRLEFAPPMEFNNKQFIGSSLESVDKITPYEYRPINNTPDIFLSLGNPSNSLV